MNGSRFCKCDNITIVRRGLCTSCGDDGDKEYGHYWIEIGNASYGWWPQGSVGAGSAGDLAAIGGVPGAINQIGIPERGRRPPQDPYHGRRDGSDEAFNPRPGFWPRRGTCASVCAAAASCIGNYARGYAGRSGGNWSLLGNSCRDFQKGAMGACGLQ